MTVGAPAPHGRRAPLWLAAAWALAAAAAAGGVAIVFADPLRGALTAIVLYAFGAVLGLPLLALTWSLLARRAPGFRHRAPAAVAAAWLLPAAGALAAGAAGAHPLAVRLAFSGIPLACCAATLALVLRARRRTGGRGAPPGAAT